jgi:hypothetical protein
MEMKIIINLKNSEQPLSTAFFIRRDIPSPTNKNKKGYNGSPRPKPLPTTKSYVGMLLTNTNIELLDIQARIHFIKPFTKPMRLMMHSKKF